MLREPLFGGQVGLPHVEAGVARVEVWVGGAEHPEGLDLVVELDDVDVVWHPDEACFTVIVPHGPRRMKGSCPP